MEVIWIIHLDIFSHFPLSTQALNNGHVIYVAPHCFTD